MNGFELAQSFVLSKDLANQKSVILKLDAVGEPEGLLHLEIQGDLNGLPDGSKIVDADLPALSIKAGSPSFYDFVTNAKFSLAADKTYWIRLKAPSFLVYASYVKWMASSANANSKGKALYLGPSGTWLEATFLGSDGANAVDLNFRVGCE